MQIKRNRRGPCASAGRRVLFGATALAGLISQAYAQTPPATPAPAANKLETVVVTGFRASLDAATALKRETVGFVDSVSAEDIGKFPDSNIAESLGRVPGVQISREVTGEGLNIQIRGLGTSFTKVTLNGSSIAVASTGRTDSQNTNREVDLDLLPTDLFTKLTVSKSPTAGMLEGGAAGIVDMRSARPFDRPGQYLTASLQGTESSVAKKWGSRGSLMASKTFGDTFGILAGVSFAQTKARTTGFETIGWTNANLSAGQSSSSTRNNTGGGNWTIPETVPANAGNGLVAGDAVNQAFLLAKNPGLTITQIDNAIIPRLGRAMYEDGDKNKISGIVSVEWRPTDSLHFYLDTLAAHKKNDLARADMNWVGRFGAMIPLNMAVDGDCANGCTVTKGTFANAQFFLEYRPYIETVKLWGVNPGVEWDITDKLKFDGQANLTKSSFHRVSPTVLPITTLGSGVTVDFDNSSGGVPRINTNINLNDPSKFGWAGGRVNQQEEFRDTETKGLRGNLTWGDQAFNIKAGAAYDDIMRSITARDNSGAWQAAVCGNNPNVFLLGPNGGPGCDGASTPGASSAGLYPGYGTGYTAGKTGPLTYQGSLIPNAALPGYLMPGPTGFVTLNWDKFATDSKYAQFADSAPMVGSSNTGASAGFVQEKATSVYTELNGETKLMSMPLRYNAGLRYVRTEQIVGGFVSLPDPRNATLANGGKFPNQDNFVYFDTTYSNTLPSGSLALNLAKDVVTRLSVSKSMTRADPNGMRPGINFSAPSADGGSIGNDKLKPYISKNIDLGLDWYTGKEGYVSLTFFNKEIDGFTTNQNITQPFSALATYGVTYDSLTTQQKAALDLRGGPGSATVVLTQAVNAPGTLNVHGTELGVVQSLNRFLPVDGFGVSANVTLVRQNTTGGVSGAVALGVPKMSNNITLYYENYGYMFRISRSYADGSQAASANQNGIPLAALYNDPYAQVDFSTRFDLDRILGMKGAPQLSLDINNVNKSKQRQYFQFSNATFTAYEPGRFIALGLRMKF